MNCKIPFTKDIDFEKKLYEITSISLEHEIKVEDGNLKGDFIVSGDFKSHEVSVNKEAFSYILPFEIEIADDIDVDTIEFMIEDFTYEIVESNILRVNIDFNVIASKKEIEEEVVEEETVFRDASELFETEENLEKDLIEQEPEILETLEVDSYKEENLIVEENLERDEKIVEIREDTNIIKESENTIISSVQGVDDEYTTYHIHMVSDGESVETICTMYNSNMNILAEYNDLNNIAQGDKLIIPDKNE